MTIAANNEAFFDAIRRQETMFTETTQVPAPQPSLRKAALEALVAAEVYMEAESCNTNVRERLVKALEQLATELER